MMADDSDADTGKAAPEKEKDKNNRNKLLTGAAIGIGSAALVAALLYAKRRKSDRA
jgi:hypothetical protein